MQGGGSNCKCINGGSNGSGVNGGKITVEFNVYAFEGDSKRYVKLEDAQMLFDNLIGIDMEKHRIVGISNFQSDPEYGMKQLYDYTCGMIYTTNIIDNKLRQDISINMRLNDDDYTNIRLIGNQHIVSMDDGDNRVLSANIVSTFPGIPESTEPHSLTFYYTER